MARIKVKSKARLLSDKAKNSKRKVAELTNAEADVTFFLNSSLNNPPSSGASLTTKQLKVSLCRNVRGCSDCRHKHALPADLSVYPSSACSSTVNGDVDGAEKYTKFPCASPETKENIVVNSPVAAEAASDQSELAATEGTHETTIDIVTDEGDSGEIFMWDIDTTDIDASLLLNKDDRAVKPNVDSCVEEEATSSPTKTARKTDEVDPNDPIESPVGKSPAQQKSDQSDVGEPERNEMLSDGTPPRDARSGADRVDNPALPSPSAPPKSPLDVDGTDATTSQNGVVASTGKISIKMAQPSKKESRKRAIKTGSSQNPARSGAGSKRISSLETKSSLKSRRVTQSKNSSTKPQNLELALVPKTTKLWKCGDCSFRTNMRTALLHHRRQHIYQRQSSTDAADPQLSSARTKQKVAKNPFGRKPSGIEVKGRYSSPGIPSPADSVKYQCQECLTSSTQLHKILEYRNHRLEHRLILHCPHCEYLIDYTTSAMTRMKNHYLNSHIKMRCRRCCTHVFKGHQAGSVLEHLQTHLVEDEAWVKQRTTADSLGNPVAWASREKCPHCHRHISPASAPDHFRQHIVQDWGEVQEYFRSCLEAIGLSVAKDGGVARKSSSDESSDGRLAGDATASPSARVHHSSGKENVNGGPPFSTCATPGSVSPRMDQWTCGHCTFKTDSPEAYMKHLVDSHNPSSLSSKAKVRPNKVVPPVDRFQRKRREFESHKKKTAFKKEDKSAPIVEIAIEDDELVNSIVVNRAAGAKKGAEAESAKETDSFQDARSRTTTPAGNSAESLSPKPHENSEGVCDAYPMDKAVLNDSINVDDEEESESISRNGHSLDDSVNVVQQETNEPVSFNDLTRKTPEDDQRNDPNSRAEFKDAEVNRPNENLTSEDDEIVRPSCDADSKEGGFDGTSEQKGAIEGMSEERLDTENCASTHSTQDYNRFDDVEEQVGQLVNEESSVTKITPSTMSFESSPVKCDKSSAPSPYLKFRAHYERLEQMSPIEVLGFFRRFVTALLVCDGACALVDWEDASLRPGFYPPWLPWLDPDAKPDGFEDCVWTALLKEGLKFMFHKEKSMLN